jgi:hypothetical protein
MRYNYFITLEAFWNQKGKRITKTKLQEYELEIKQPELSPQSFNFMWDLKKTLQGTLY